MTTEELINMDLQAFGDTIAELDAVECNRCARDLFHRLGGLGMFEDYLMEVIRTAVRFHGLPHDQIAEIYAVSKRHLPDVPPGYDVFGRLTALALRIISLSLPPVRPSRGR